MRSNAFSPDFRVLLLTPTPKDAQVTANILQQYSIHCLICSTIETLCEEIAHGADAAIITEESIRADKRHTLEKTLKNQPSWSDFPLIVLMPSGREYLAATLSLLAIGNMTLIARPIQISTLITTVQTVLRDRKRQYHLRDDLQRREAQAKALTLSEQRTRSIIDTALDAVVMTGSQGIIAEWNRQAEIIFGWTREEAVGKPMAELIIPEQYRAMHQVGMERYVSTGQHRILNQRIEITALHKSGRIFPVELTVTAQHHGGETFFTSFTRDITGRLATEQAVQEARDHLELMVESARDFAIISLDKAGEIISWNAGAGNIFGTLASEALGRSLDFIFTPEDCAAGVPQAEMRKAAEVGHASDERWHVRKDGERFYASGIMAAMLDTDGAVKGFIKIARDRTDQKAAEEAIIAARNAAEAANIAKTEFLANMSHEIRTPMNAVIGLSTILAMSQPLTEKQRQFIKTLQMSADSLLALINDLLDIAKIEARTVDLEQVPFSLAQLVQEVVSMMTVRVREKGLEFTGDEDAIQNRRFIGDPTRLRQIIVNLCSNAVKFTEYGGIHIRITCAKTENPDIETICIAVRDTGIGIAADKLDTIFEKFVQADSSINRKYGGTGLGLAITKTLTEIMGGSIKAESDVGKGSIFTVAIPLHIANGDDLREENQSLPAIFKGAVARKKTQILLVEDYAANVLVAKTFLEEFGYGYDVASNGIEAIDKVKSGNFSAVLMDVQMHGMNGLEATQLIREYERARDLNPIPIIGMTAHALAGDRERCLAAGMDDYLSKPFNPIALRLLLETLAPR